MKQQMRKVMVSLVVALTCAISGEVGAQWIVNDPINFVQNTLTALDSVTSNINEARQIAAQLQQYENMVQNTASLPAQTWNSAQATLNQLQNVVQTGNSIAYSMSNVGTAFQQRFPGYKAQTNPQQAYSSWSSTALDSIRGSLQAANVQSSNITDETSALSALRSLADGSDGQKAAIDAGNRIATMQVEQQQKLRQLIMAQMQSQNAYMATQVQNQDQQRSSIQAASQYVDPSKGVTPQSFKIEAPAGSF